MAHARPFSTSTLQELSNNIKNTSRQGVLTPAIEVLSFQESRKSPKSPFREFKCHLHTPSKWGCNTPLYAWSVTNQGSCFDSLLFRHFHFIFRFESIKEFGSASNTAHILDFVNPNSCNVGITNCEVFKTWVVVLSMGDTLLKTLSSDDCWFWSIEDSKLIEEGFSIETSAIFESLTSMEKWLFGETWGTFKTNGFQKTMASTRTWGCFEPWAFDKPWTWLSFDTSLGIENVGR